MRKLVLKKNIQKSKVVLISSILVFFLTLFLFNLYSKKTSIKLVEIAKIKLQEFMESFLSNNIGYDILNENDLNNMIVINKNKDGEILYLDYNLDRAYNTLDIVTSKLNELITNLENGKYDVYDKNIIQGKNCIALKLPMFVSSSNLFLNNLTPNIYIPINFVGTLLTNIRSDIRNYGLNNALLELYITIKITSNLITPVEKENFVISYDVLIASTVVNGRVPEVYGGILSKESNVFATSF